MPNTAHKTHFELLPNGQLAKLNEWTAEAANYLAHTQGIELNDAHWDIINLMRDFYNEYNISPVHKLLIKHIREKFGADKANDKYLNTLFPGGVLAQGTLIAGLPTPLMDTDTSASKPLSHLQNTLKSRLNVKHFQDQFEMDGQIFKLTFHGNLTDISQWNEKVAAHMAKQEGIELSDEHWEVINFLRDFYFKYEITPMVRLLQKHLAKKLGSEKGSEKYLYNLFPDGPARQGSRIAGLPEPQGCID